jgi:KUP system potassium uptake protein
MAWYVLVLPALLLNYFGQGALLLHDPARVAQPFYQLAPHWALYPLVVLATAATVIASQAVISGVFSLASQAVQLGLYPRIAIVHTSSEEAGQVYSPTTNWALMLLTIALVVGFGSSSGLAGAYGVAVSATMVITTILIFFIMRERWKWSPLLAAFVAAAFLSVDLAFFGSNLLKIADGGWVPILAAVLVFTIMSTWRRGREILFGRLDQRRDPLTKFLARIVADPPIRIPGTGIFLTASGAGTPPVLLHHLAHNKVLHERVILLTVTTEEKPRIPAASRLAVEDLDHGFYKVIVHYGFMQSPDVPVALRLGKELGLEVDIDNSSFYVGRATPIPTENVLGMMLWREKLFAFMNRVGARADAFYRIPPQRVVELGIQVEV